jgi:hypothetical protein
LVAIVAAVHGHRVEVVTQPAQLPSGSRRCVARMRAGPPDWVATNQTAVWITSSRPCSGAFRRGRRGCSPSWRRFTDAKGGGDQARRSDRAWSPCVVRRERGRNLTTDALDRARGLRGKELQPSLDAHYLSCLPIPRCDASVLALGHFQPPSWGRRRHTSRTSLSSCCGR